MDVVLQVTGTLANGDDSTLTLVKLKIPQKSDGIGGAAAVGFLRERAQPIIPVAAAILLTRFCPSCANQATPTLAPRLNAWQALLKIPLVLRGGGGGLQRGPG